MHALFADAALSRAEHLFCVCLKIKLLNFQLGMSGNYKASLPGLCKATRFQRTRLGRIARQRAKHCGAPQPCPIA